MARWFPVLGVALLLFPAQTTYAGTNPVSCSLAYNLPADIPVPVSDADPDTFQQFGWESFLALNAPVVGGQIDTTGDNTPQWSAWSSTVDLRRIRRQITLLDAAYALTLEAIRGEIEALDERTHAARGIPGQIEAARAMRCILAGSRWTSDEGRRCLGETEPRLQDAVSLRSSPHIHGALREIVAFATAALDREVNASTLNPLMFSRPGDSGHFDVVMGGNYDGAQRQGHARGSQQHGLIRPRMCGLPLGRGSAAVVDLIRSRVDPPGDDRFFRDDVLAVRELVQNLELMYAVRGFTAGSGDIGQTIADAV